jgi:nucleotide-binding universal stress UspA family protein
MNGARVLPDRDDGIHRGSLGIEMVIGRNGHVMAKRILVPLDKKEASEQILPLVADLARNSGATLRLLHVAPIPERRQGEDGRVIAYADQEMARLEAEARDHFEPVEATLDGLPVETVVRFGDPVAEILTEAESFGADLIAMTTRRRGWWPALRHISRHVFRKAQVPVVMLRVA